METPIWRWRTQRKCVGVIGLLGAGKTVLVTSLINHLKQHNKDRFPLMRRGRELSVVELRRLRPSFGRPFNYERHRSRMVDHRWPDKTVQLEEYRAVYLRKGSGGRLDLSLLDIPGERLGDVTIANHSSFEAWSDATLNAFESFPEFEGPAKPFQDFLNEAEKSDQCDEAGLLRAYRGTLAHLFVSCIPIIAPSTFALPLDGQLPPRDVLEGDTAGQIRFLVEHRFAGIDPEHEFAPLPAGLRASQPALAKLFRTRFQLYRTQVALPFGNALKACDELLVLVDLAMLLEGGSGMLNANHQLAEELFRYAEPGWGMFRSLADWPIYVLGGGLLGLSGIGRIGFVATKADRVHDEDHNHLVWLLKEAVGQAITGHQEERTLQVDYFVCSAVRSTECEKSDGEGRRILRFAHNGEPRQQDVPEVPDSWPPSWNPSEYTFPEPRPRFPASRLRPPDHINLHHIAEFILG
jgi:uncharacterized protein